jgi:hypothetical protein
MNLTMSSGTVRLKGQALRERLTVNMHQLSQTEQVSYPTIWKYLNKPEELGSFSADVLYALIVEGMGISPEEAADLRLGDVFEFVSARNGDKPE